MPTHEVLNQSVPLADYNVYQADPALQEAVTREGASWAVERLVTVGKLAGSSAVLDWGDKANKVTPILRTHDRFGHRVDEVEFHPAWHQLMSAAIEHELHALPWRDPRPGAHVARAALFMTLTQAEAGFGCPIS